MKQFTMKAIALSLGLLTFTGAFAQEEKKEENEGYKFTMEKENPATSVKNQYRSGTCWSFSALSFMESELLRMGKGEFDLSEMFVVRKCYEDKAQRYVRMHGKLNFGGGGASHDIPYVWSHYGIVPETAYTGLTIGEKNHIHGEMDKVLNDYLDGVIENKNNKLTPVWYKGYEGIVDAYLGEEPATFEYNGKKYTPKSFADELAINPDDYIKLTSYTHHPFYQPFIIEVEDNWLWGEALNLPIDELMEVMYNAIDKGYTFVWGADVSEKGFSWTNGVAIVPDVDLNDMSGTEKEKWEKLTSKEKKAAMFSFDKPVPEMKITQAMRQEGFDNYTTTDDHGMHITGVAKDQNGNKYFYVKNSWGFKNHKYNGYFYASDAFVRYKTMDIMVHKDAIPKQLRKKLGIK